MVGISNLEPSVAVTLVLQLGHNSFQVLFTRQAKELHAVPLDVVRVEKDGRLLGDDGTEQALAPD